MHKKHKISYVILFCILLLILLSCGIAFYSFYIEPFRLTIDTLSLESSLSQEVRIVQVSDIQISRHYTTEDFEKVVQAVNHQQPDILLFTGDLYENYASYRDDKELISLLSQMDAKYGKFAIWGNRDYGGGAVRKYESILAQSGFTLLTNASVSIPVSDTDTVFLAGLDDALLGQPDIAPILEQLPKEENTYTILMTHEPDTAEQYAQMGFDLIVSGHSHGGQVKIPFFPTMTTHLGERYIDGLYPLNDQTQLYVNSGIGTSRIPVRFRVPPEITLLLLNQAA